MTVSDINMDKRDGKLLLAALAILTTENRPTKTPDQVIDELAKLSIEMGYDPGISTEPIMMELSVKRERGFEMVSQKHQQGSFLMLPKQGTAGSAGYDFFLPEDITLNPGDSSGIIFTNVKAYMNDDEVLKLFIRSSIGIKKGIILSNLTGIVDSDYYNNPSNDGNIGIALKNMSNRIVSLKQGERIMQGVFEKFLQSDNCFALKMEERTGGYGSTDKK